MMLLHRIFFDTEFSSLTDPNPQLISIGLIDHAGLNSFYAEVERTPELIEACHPWVREHVFRYLEGGAVAMPREDLARALYTWLSALPADRQLTLISDAPDMDAVHVHKLLEITGYPPNMDRQIRPVKMPSSIGWQRYQNVLWQTQSGKDYRAHHALDDAKANRVAWLAGHRNATLARLPGGATFEP